MPCALLLRALRGGGRHASLLHNRAHLAFARRAASTLPPRVAAMLEQAPFSVQQV